MVGSLNIVVAALNQLGVGLVNFIPKLIVTLVIWWVGKYLINLGVKLIRKIDFKGSKIDDKIIAVFTSIISVAGKLLLILIILDYWDIGTTVIGALAYGLTLTFAIALGMAFGKALEPEAKNIVEALKNKIEK